MLIFVAIFVVICCGLVIILGISLSCKLESVGDDVVRIKDNVGKIYVELPYNSWFMSTYRDLDKKLDDINDHLTTEIACLATKNNEDIKRMKDGWQEGDVIESNGELYDVLAPVYNTNDDGNLCGYRLIDQDRAYSYSAKELVENATLIKHTSGLSDIFDE
jgi:hypothetical protein